MKLEEFWSKSRTVVYDENGKMITSKELLKMRDRLVAEFEPYREGIMVILED